jgi:hypothetical protein
MKPKRKILFVLLLAAISLKFQCDKGAGMEVPIDYTFAETVSITPYRLNYNIGDTFWINVIIPGKKLFDTKTSTKIFYDSASFNSIAQVDLLYNNPFIANGPFARFIFPQGVSAYTNTGGPQTYANITYGCAPSTDYRLSVGVILIEKGVFGISFFNTYINKCFSNTFKRSQLTFSFDVNDAHKQYYQQLPFINIGKQPSDDVLQRLDRKTTVVINVQ